MLVIVILFQIIWWKKIKQKNRKIKYIPDKKFTLFKTNTFDLLSKLCESKLFFRLKPSKRKKNWENHYLLLKGVIYQRQIHTKTNKIYKDAGRCDKDEIDMWFL